MPPAKSSALRCLPVCAIVFGILCSSADASVIWIYKEVEAVSAAASVTGLNGDTYIDAQQASGSILSDLATSGLHANASLTGLEAPDGYLDGLEVGSGAAITEHSGQLEFGISTGPGADCNLLACSAGSATGMMDLTFRPGDRAGFEARYYPTGGVIHAVLTDLTAGTIIHEAHGSTLDIYGTRFMFEFPDNHLYRFVASGESVMRGGDPYADFSVRFYDSVTDAGADFAPVPEPMSLLLVGSGVAGMIARRRRHAPKITAREDAILESALSQ